MLPLAMAFNALALDNTNPPIDRHALVTRHNFKFQSVSPENVLTVGNGNFAFTTDFTGLQTFPDFYHQGVPLCTMANWAWHSYPNPHHFTLADVMQPMTVRGKKGYYPTVGFPIENDDPASQWLNENPHRFSLGQLGFFILKHDGSEAGIADLKLIRQDLDLWTGTIYCWFEVEGIPVQVTTAVAPDNDCIAASIKSALLSQGRLGIRLRFPYPTHNNDPSDWSRPEAHRTTIEGSNAVSLNLKCEADDACYHVLFQSGTPFQTHGTGPHQYILLPEGGTNSFALTCAFSAQPIPKLLPPAEIELAATEAYWEKFWRTGGMVDFTGSTDPRAHELERRIVLSQYLTAIQSAGKVPPQETGLTMNSWNGKFNLEVHWFHEAHFALWGHPELLEQSMDWYLHFLPQARELAKSYGQTGARWPKMVGPEGRESPNHINPFILWQQPNIIYLAELCYRSHPTEATLKKYKSLVMETADFLASAMNYESKQCRYVLGPPVVPPPELLEVHTNYEYVVWPPEKTFNPTFELAYWDFGLRTAQTWRERLGLKRNSQWDKILQKLSPLPLSNARNLKTPLYIHAENGVDLWTNSARRIQHPTFLMAKGMLPGNMVNDETMKNTLFATMNLWDYDQMWGTDFPVMAMTATRLGLPKVAIDCLFLPAPNNNFGTNGLQREWQIYPTYLTSNAALLEAVALMTAGFGGCREPLPGFSKDGTWKVHYEGILPLP